MAWLAMAEQQKLRAKARSLRLRLRLFCFGWSHHDAEALFRRQHVIGNVARLPDFAAPLIAARPENARPQYVPDASYALTPTRF